MIMKIIPTLLGLLGFAALSTGALASENYGASAAGRGDALRGLAQYADTTKSRPSSVSKSKKKTVAPPPFSWCRDDDDDDDDDDDRSKSKKKGKDKNKKKCKWRPKPVTPD